jgi:hypothetical protein
MGRDEVIECIIEAITEAEKTYRLLCEVSKEAGRTPQEFSIDWLNTDFTYSLEQLQKATEGELDELLEVNADRFSLMVSALETGIVAVVDGDQLLLN